MYKLFKKPEVPTSSPDVMTFPFEYGPFQFTMENYVRSFTRKRVTKENLAEVMEEVNVAIKPQADSFKTWDYISLIFLLVLNVGMLACVLTLQLNLVFLLVIKIGVVFVGFILNFVIYMCCLNGSSTRLREKVQEILDSKDEYFESKGMRWIVCADTEFPFWIELHIQSQFEMKLKQEKDQHQGKKTETQKTTNYSENKGILDGQAAKKAGAVITNKKPNKKGFVNLEEFNEEDEDDDYENQAHVEAEVEIEDELAQVEDEEEQGSPEPDSQPHQQDVRLEVKKNGKFDRLYAPLEEDYEENYHDEASP